jgi:glycosyltransferase involved in cell wall biosynthesis
MKVSIVIPTYNRGYILREALKSALAQKHEDTEILLVDDGSSDDTREIVKSMASDKIQYICHERNRGCSAAYNTGIAQATGELVAFLDSDDVWNPEYLERQVDFLTRHPDVDLVFCDTEVRGPSVDIPSIIALMNAFPKLLKAYPPAPEYVFSARDMYLCLLEEVPIKPTAAVTRRELFSVAGLFDEDWPSGTDWDLFLRMSRVARFGYIDQVLVKQKHGADTTHRRFFETDKMFLLSRFLKEKTTLNGDREALKQINRGIGGLYNSLAWLYLESGHNKKALSTYSRGFRETLQPLLLRKLAVGIFRVVRRSI